MVVLPPHRKLQKPVETCQRDRARNANPPPDRWLDLRELNVKPVDTPRAVTSHLSCPPILLVLLIVKRILSPVCSSRGVSGSLNPVLQLVTLVDPVMPILNGLLGLLIHLNALQLYQGN